MTRQFVSRVLLLAMLILGAAAACTPAVGDPCTSSTQCSSSSGASLYCDLATPEGYCTKSPCTKNSCPEEATCVDFGTEASFCMRSCSPDDECREGLACRSALACDAAESVTRTAANPCSWERKSFCGVKP